jgi:hypothetical protein
MGSARDHGRVATIGTQRRLLVVVAAVCYKAKDPQCAFWDPGKVRLAKLLAQAEKVSQGEVLRD